MNEELKIINAYNKLIYSIYNIQELICLSDNEYQYNGENVLALNNPAVVTASNIGLLTRLADVCKKLKNNNFQKNPNISISELITASGDIKYRLGILYLYQPYIVNLSSSYGFFRGKKHYSYNQTTEDLRFNGELPIAFECLYKFWQRLSDYLTSFFPELLLEKNGLTYFHAPFEYISKYFGHIEASENYKWLKDFSVTKYPLFNKHRKFFVHYSGYNNQFFEKFISVNQNDSKAIKNLDLERENWTTFLKDQLVYCNEGYLKLMYFLNELNIQRNNNGEFTYQLKSI